MAAEEGAGGMDLSATAASRFQADMAVSKALETAKFQLLQKKASCKKELTALQQKIAAAEAQIFARRQKLSVYNALFMHVEDANTRAPFQRLGATQAVLGTKRIVERELHKLSKEAGVVEMKLNKVKDRNLHLRGTVDSLRKEHITFRALFQQMNGELDKLKGRVAEKRLEVEKAYEVRDKAQTDMMKLEEQYLLEKAKRAKQWRKLSKRIAMYMRAEDPDEKLEGLNLEEGVEEGLDAESDSELDPAALMAATARKHDGKHEEGEDGDGAGGMSPEQEEAARQDIVRNRREAAAFREELHRASVKRAAYADALEQIRAATGFDSLEHITSILKRYEDDKYAKLAALTRGALEVEQIETEVAALRHEIQEREAAQAAEKAAKAAETAALEKQAADLEAAVKERDAATERVLGEAKAIFPVIEFLFHAIGCSGALGGDAGGDAPAATPASGHGGFSAALSPLRSPTASLKMYKSAALAESMRGGVTASSLAQWMGLVENRSADIIQQYAAAVATGAVREDGEDDDGASSIAGGVDALGDGAPRHFLSPAALGPSKPTGKLKESLTTSSLVAALAISMGADTMGTDGSKGGGAGSTVRSGTARGLPSAGGDDDSEEDDAGTGRPMSLAELKRAAEASLTSDRGVRSISQAASIAASVLSREASAAAAAAAPSPARS